MAEDVRAAYPILDALDRGKYVAKNVGGKTVYSVETSHGIVDLSKEEIENIYAQAEARELELANAVSERVENIIRYMETKKAVDAMRSVADAEKTSIDSLRKVLSM